MANTHEHLEHAEHAEHNAHDPFNQRVAVSMAIVAALLAAISMVGHRTHNKVLQLQGDSNRSLGDVNRVLGDVNRVIGEANRTGTEAAEAEVEKSNLFAWYQSKRGRQEQLNFTEQLMETLPGTEILPKDPAPADKKKAEELAAKRAKIAADAKKRATDYSKSNEKKDNLPDLIERGNEAAKRADLKRAEAAKLREEAAKYREEAAGFKKEAAKKQEDAEHVHHQADRFDIAHLSAEIGLVLCSIALLTKKKTYWFLGLGAAVLALALTASGYLIPHHEPHDVPSHATPDDKGKPSEKEKPH
jgi:hypothetical protein